MNRQFMIGIDQSTQGTKALLFDEAGRLIQRSDLPHAQLINSQGWVSHDLEEIYGNVIQSIKNLIQLSQIDKRNIAAIGISNQRETTGMWDKQSLKPYDMAIVWQCGRAEEITKEIAAEGCGEIIRGKTGIPLSPYFPASKMAWLLRRHPNLAKRAENGEICIGTIDSWLLHRLTKGAAFCTDYSNASRTQLFNIHTLQWDQELCHIFGIPRCALAQVKDSDACFGYTDLDGYLETEVPIRSMLGDSHAALFGQGCIQAGMIKATYGTGSSLMLNTGEKPVDSKHGVATSLAWSIGGRVSYVLEGNLNYTGAAVSWLKNDLGIITSAQETQALARAANQADTTYLVPAFTGLGAPYWQEDARAAFIGMTRITRREELVKATLECIGYQIADLLFAMEQDTGEVIGELRVDGGASRNEYLMQFQSDILQKRVLVLEEEELSGIGAAYLAGLSQGLYRMDELFAQRVYTSYQPVMQEAVRMQKYAGWKKAVGRVLE